MNTIMTDEEHKAMVTSYYKTIRMALDAVDNDIKKDDSETPRYLRIMGELIERFAKGAQEVGWPDPVARAALAAKQDAGLQKLLTRAMKPTPVRATKKAVAASRPSL